MDLGTRLVPAMFAPILPTSWLRLAVCFAICAAGEIAGAEPSVPDTDWPEYLGGPDRSHYSPLAQITTENVQGLTVAWSYATGDLGQVQCNPLVVDGVLYGVTATNVLFALEAGTGRERWRFSPEGAAKTGRTLRGVAFWSRGADRRILYSSDDRLYAVDADSGRLKTSFGDGGSVSLKTALGPQAAKKFVGTTTPGTIFEDLIVMPTRVGEGEGAAPGHIQAFHVVTGKLAWVFHTLPQEGEFGRDTWPADAFDHEQIGGANSWAGMAVDRERGILYVPTGSAAPDFWGGDREGENLFANCLLALDARTGKRLWHFQFVRHDIWDRDLPAPPNLVTLRRDGKDIPAVAQVTKSGHVFVFDRVTGQPLFPIDDVPVPASELPGEKAWPTQPVPRLPAPFARQTLEESDLNPKAKNYDELLAEFRRLRRGAFMPFDHRQGTLIFPGFDGAAEWGGAAVDPAGVLYVNSNEMAWIGRLSEAPSEAQLAEASPGRRVYLNTCVACHGPDLQGNPASGFPELKQLSSRRTRSEVTEVILRGKGMMPGFGHLPLSQREALLGYLLGDEKIEAPDSVVTSDRGAGPASTGSTAATRKVPYKFGGYVKFLDQDGYPAIRPPWGTLTAIDLNTGEHRWQVTLGNFQALTSEGQSPTGTENYGGPLITAGDVLFIAATKDGRFRAFDRRDGRLLWETVLPAAGFATPTTYAVGGRQYVVIACGGGKLGVEKGDRYVAFALPLRGRN